MFVRPNLDRPIETEQIPTRVPPIPTPAGPIGPWVGFTAQPFFPKKKASSLTAPVPCKLQTWLPHSGTPLGLTPSPRERIPRAPSRPEQAPRAQPPRRRRRKRDNLTDRPPEATAEESCEQASAPEPPARTRREETAPKQRDLHAHVRNTHPADMSSRSAKASTKLEDRLGADVLARLQSMAHEFGTFPSTLSRRARRPPSRRSEPRTRRSYRGSQIDPGWVLSPVSARSLCELAHIGACVPFSGCLRFGGTIDR